MQRWEAILLRQVCWYPLRGESLDIRPYHYLTGLNIRSIDMKAMVKVLTFLMLMLLGTTTMGAQSVVATPQEVTFTKHVAPILQRACQSCHRPDNIAPMSLLTYEQARPWAKSIKEKILLRIMPPWYIDP